MTTARRAASVTLLALLVSLALSPIAFPETVRAATTWGVAISPTSISQGQATALAVRATNVTENKGIRCVVISVPSGITVLGVTVTATTGKTPWTAAVSSGGGGTLVSIWNVDALGKLQQGDWVDVSVSVRGDVPGTYAWTAAGFHDSACWEEPLPETNTVFVTVAGSAPPPATPTPPPPASGATPTPAPPAPDPGGGGTDGTARPSPTGSDGASTEPRATRDDDDDDDGGGPSGSASPDDEGTASAPGSLRGPGGAPGGGGGSPPRAPLAVDVGGAAADAPIGGGILASPVGLAALSLLDDAHVWFVPGAVVGVPGLLLLIVVAVQMAGGALWIPVTRRLIGRDAHRFGSAERMWWES